jgi:Ca2+-transporting ATPase
MAYHDLSISETIKKLNTDEKTGLSQDEANKRIIEYGLNELEKGKKISALHIFLSQFTNIMVIILLIGGFISLLINEELDALTIFIILILNAILGFVQEYKAENAMKALLNLTNPHARVIRDSKEQDILSKNLVPGDIIILEVGDKVSANIRLLNSFNLEVNQAHLTGESNSIPKFSKAIESKTNLLDWNNIVFMGSIVTNGKALGVVIQTGMNTEIGKIAKNITNIKQEKTPLQYEIDKLAKVLAKVVIIAVTVLFFLGILLKKDFFEMLMTSVSLAVAAVPEGLPAVVTVTLALGMQRMAKKNALIRKLPAVQTLGNVTVICSDKTGTLTKNEMTVKKIFNGFKDYEITGSGYDKVGDFLVEGKKLLPKDLDYLFKISCLCNNSFVDFDENKIIGDPTEASLLVMSKKAGWDYNLVKKDYKELAELSFDSKRKMMSVVEKKDDKIYLMTKGAPDIIISNCSKILINNKLLTLTAQRKKELLKKNEEFASKALRVLGFGFKEIKEEKKYDTSLEKDLIFVGIAGMIDPARDEVKEAIKKAKQAGIKIKVLTGDHVITAKAIAQEIGLMDNDSIAISSEELDKLSEEDFSKMVHKAVVFARISPENKLRIVNELKAKGEIVAVTGDGVNDAPALKASHIGISMGITGTDVTKESSQMVLLDDNFSTIVNAIEEGRGIFDNIKKFVKFLLASNADTIVVVTTMVLVGLPLPYIPVHILWMNLITDGLPAIALSVEKPDADVMRRKPRDPNYSLIRELGLFIIVAGIIDALSSIILFIYGLNFEGFFIDANPYSLMKARTMAISSAIIYELFFVFNCRDDEKGLFLKSFKENFLSNKYLTLAVLFSFILQLCFIYLPFFNTLFQTTPLNLFEMFLVLFFASFGLLIRPKWFHKDITKLFKKKPNNKTLK